MDVLDRVRDGAPEAALSEARIAAARVRVVEGIGSSTKGRRSIRRRVLVWGIGSAATGAVAASVLVLALPGPSQTKSIETSPSVLPTSTPSAIPNQTSHPTPPLTPAAAFHSAANAAVSGGMLRPGPGQFLRIEATTESVVFFDEELGWGGYSADRLNAEGAWTVRNSMSIFAPYEQAGEWTFNPGNSEIVAKYGDAEPGIEQWSRDGGDAVSEPLVLQGGPMPPWEGIGGEFTMVAFLASMPADPAAVVDWITARQDDGGQGKVGWLLIDLLASNAGTPEQRSVMYNALALLDETEIVAQDGDVVSIAFRRPYFGDDPAQMIEHTVTIDLATSLVLEMTEREGAGSALVQDEVPDLRRTYTFSVVDAIN